MLPWTQVVTKSITAALKLTTLQTKYMWNSNQQIIAFSPDLPVLQKPLILTGFGLVFISSCSVLRGNQRFVMMSQWPFLQQRKTGMLN